MKSYKSFGDYDFERQSDDQEMQVDDVGRSLQETDRPIQYYERRLCLKNVPIDMTEPQVMKLLEDFEGVTAYMPKTTHNKQLGTKLVYLDFQKPW